MGNLDYPQLFVFFSVLNLHKRALLVCINGKMRICRLLIKDDKMKQGSKAGADVLHCSTLYLILLSLETFDCSLLWSQ